MEMLKKRLICVMGALACIVSLGGCQKSGESLSTTEKIENQWKQMKSYQCTATLKRTSNKGENTYETKQYYKRTGEYRLELTSPENVAGNYTVFDGKSICQYNPKVGGKVIVDVPDSQPRNELFLGQFIDHYTQSSEIEPVEEENTIVFETVIPGGNQYLATEKLWVDQETLKPTQFVIYDQNGKERYRMEFHDFEYDVELVPELFQIPK